LMHFLLRRVFAFVADIVAFRVTIAVRLLLSDRTLELLNKVAFHVYWLLLHHATHQLFEHGLYFAAHVEPVFQQCVP